ncbi:proline racemase [Bosea sp. Leaf344]|uniref:proline racemase family protein n=1 Tax=Bosea sp. Leaf344 TaxID=1736346 RepID=UPI0006F7F23A|nr:proline racemase family protein [Bosea sp. Leaf344]KQU54698.1 proline racemase [Bosea sp. Leaf344]
MQLRYLDYHTCGEPVRIVTSGYPRLEGESLLEKRREARAQHDAYRRAVMLEPRGHSGMYGVLPVRSSRPEAAFGVLFTHNEGYSTMCGHATIALGRYAIEHGLVEAVEPVTRFAIEAPCGLLRLACEVVDGRVGEVRFESVPAFAHTRDRVVEVPGLGRIITDIAYGGAFYCILPASRFGLDLLSSPLNSVIEAAVALTDAVRAGPITHPTEPDLGFLYGTIVTDDARPGEESHNLCVFAERQIDRSPTGSGVTARMALDYAKGLVRPGEQRVFRSITGGAFTGRILTELAQPIAGAVTVEVGGRSHFAGEGSFTIESDDPLGWGFELPARFGDLARAARPA